MQRPPRMGRLTCPPAVPNPWQNRVEAAYAMGPSHPVQDSIIPLTSAMVSTACRAPLAIPRYTPSRLRRKCLRIGVVRRKCRSPSPRDLLCAVSSQAATSRRMPRETKPWVGPATGCRGLPPTLRAPRPRSVLGHLAPRPVLGARPHRPLSTIDLHQSVSRETF